MKHDVKQYVRRVSHVLKGADEGAGTISGVALIAIVAAMLGAVAMAGNLLLCVHRAQNTADLASVAAAQWTRARSLCPGWGGCGGRRAGGRAGAVRTVGRPAVTCGAYCL